MPTYQYTCTACHDQLELVQKFTDDPLTVCPSCQGQLRKVFNAVGVVFKGSGFYRTDSRASENGSAAKGNGSGKDSANGSKDKASSDAGSSSSGSSSSESSSSGSSSSESSSSSTSSSGSSGSKAKTESAA